MSIRLCVEVVVALVCTSWVATCTDDQGVGGNDLAEAALFELDYGGGPVPEGMLPVMELGVLTAWMDPAGMNRLVDAGGTGPIRVRIRGHDGEIVTEVRADNLEELESLLHDQGQALGEGLAASTRRMLESMTPEEQMKFAEYCGGCLSR